MSLGGGRIANARPPNVHCYQVVMNDVYKWFDFWRTSMDAMCYR